jgi:hypothetical protein
LPTRESGNRATRRGNARHTITTPITTASTPPISISLRATFRRSRAQNRRAAVGRRGAAGGWNGDGASG